MRIDVENLKKLREDRALSLRELAQASGVSHTTIWDHERGKEGAHPAPYVFWRGPWVLRPATSWRREKSRLGKKKASGNGTGTVYQRKNGDGRVTGYRGAYHGPDGRRRYVSARNKGECERKLREAMTDADRGLIFDSPNLRLGDYLDRWLEDSVKDPCARGPTSATSR
jgi:hypothetical protein